MLLAPSLTPCPVSGTLYLCPALHLAPSLLLKRCRDIPQTTPAGTPRRAQRHDLFSPQRGRQGTQCHRAEARVTQVLSTGLTFEVSSQHAGVSQATRPPPSSPCPALRAPLSSWQPAQPSHQAHGQAGAALTQTPWAGRDRRALSTQLISQPPPSLPVTDPTLAFPQVCFNTGPPH